MNFCATCGRQRTGDARFCDDCGTAFAQDAVAAPSAAPQPSAAPPADEPTRWDPPVDATRAERQPDATRLDPLGTGYGATPAPPAVAEPDPFASWFEADPPEGRAPKRNDPPGQWQHPGPWNAADTVYAPPANRAAASPPPQPPPYGAQQVRSSGGKKAAFIIVVVLVMLAAGGGAYALVSRSNRHTTTQPTAPAVTASASATPSGHKSASASASPSTSTSPTTSASASTSPPAGVVSLGPGVASNPAEPAVETTLTHYFQGINTHNYAEYSKALDPQVLAAESEAQFNSGYASTVDSGMTLTSLQSNADGGLDATVTFTSHQDPSASIDNSPCNNWTLTLFLVPQGAGYLQGLAPSDYHAIHSDC